MTYADAIAWLTDNADTDRPPSRLHDRAIGDDGAPRMSARLLAWLMAEPFDVVRVSEIRHCFHPRNNGEVLMCPDCNGDGVYEGQVWRYRRPMRAALERLRLRPGRAWPERQPQPYTILRALYLHGLDGPAAALHMGIGWDRYEALVVMAVAKLRGRYQEPPYRVGWRTVGGTAA